MSELPLERQRELAREAFREPEGEALLQNAIGKPDALYQSGALFQSDPAKADDYRSALRAAIESKRSNVPMVKVADVPAVLRALEISERDVVIDRDTVRKATNGVKHAVPMDVVERLPELLSNPIAVLESKTQPGSFVVILDATEPGKGHVMAALRPDHAAGRSLVVHEITTLHGRSANQFNSMAAEGRALYVRQKDDPGSVRDKGLQLPKAGSPSRGPSGKVLSEADVVKLHQPGTDAPRGSIVFRRADGRLEMNVTLLAGADRSTFMHEAAHGFMEMMGDLSRDQGAPQRLRDDFDTLLRYGRAEDHRLPPARRAASRGIAGEHAEGQRWRAWRQASIRWYARSTIYPDADTRRSGHHEKPVIALAEIGGCRVRDGLSQRLLSFRCRRLGTIR